jgi:hypothetical protein
MYGFMFLSVFCERPVCWHIRGIGLVRLMLQVCRRVFLRHSSLLVRETVRVALFAAGNARSRERFAYPS